MITLGNKNALATVMNFSPVNAVVARRAPASPMVVNSLVQPLIETINNLSQKVDALAVRQVGQPQIIHVPAALPVRAKPVESREADFDDDSSSQQDTRVKRSSLLDFFD